MAKILDSVVLAIGSNPDGNPFSYCAELPAMTNFVDVPSPTLNVQPLPTVAVLMRDGSFSFSESATFGPAMPDLYTGAAKAGTVATGGAPVCSFSVDLKGGGQVLAPSPDAQNCALSSAVAQILEGAGVIANSNNAAPQAMYWLWAGVSGGQTMSKPRESSPRYKTIKIWIGKGSIGYSVILTGCFFDLTFNLSAGETCSMDVDVHCSGYQVQTLNSAESSWPTVDYGSQGTLGAPVLASANATMTGTGPGDGDGVVYTRGFSECTISFVREKLSGYDSNSTNFSGYDPGFGASGDNVTRGLTNVSGPGSTITYSGNWYSQTGTSTGGDSGEISSRWFAERSLRRWRDVPQLFSQDFMLGTDSSTGERQNRIRFINTNMVLDSYEWTPQAGAMSLTLNASSVGIGSGNTVHPMLKIGSLR